MFGVGNPVSHKKKKKKHQKNTQKLLSITNIRKILGKTSIQGRVARWKHQEEQKSLFEELG